MMRRGNVNKYRSSKKFRGQMRKTKRANVGKAPQRGGWRM